MGGLTIEPSVGPGVPDGIQEGIRRAGAAELRPLVSYGEAEDLTYQVVGQALESAGEQGFTVTYEQQSLFAEVVVLLALAGLDLESIREATRRMCAKPPIF